MGEVRVWSVPMRTRFRGITVREGMLIRGEAGWGEWSPFLEYDAAVAEPWLRCAEEAAAGDWPEPVRAAIPVNVTVPAVGPEQAAEIVRRGGCRTAKVKVAEPGQTLADDQARLEAVRDALGPTGAVRVDANGGWSVDDAVGAIAVLDLQPLGGVRACLRIAEDIGLPVVVSSALESSVGIAAGVALAAALPELPFACGLATVQLLGEDLAAEPLLPVDGALLVRRPEVDEGMLSRLSASPDRVANWEARLAEVRALRQDRFS
jgi:O-succinylbenzoate synthase